MARSSRKSHSVSGKTVVPANTAPPTATRALPSRVAARQIPDPDMGINRLHTTVSLPPKRGSPLPARVEEDRCTRASHTRRPAGFPETLAPVSAARPLGPSRRQAGFRGPSPTPGGSHWAGRPDPRLRRWWWAVQASRSFRLGGAQGIGKMPRFVFRPKRRGSVHKWCGMVPTTSGRRRQLRDQLPHGYRAVRILPLLDRLADGPCRKAPVLAASSHRQAMGGSGRTT